MVQLRGWVEGGRTADGEMAAGRELPPDTRIFTPFSGFEELSNQSLTAFADPLPRLAKAHFVKRTE
jgi:hypothetical protein